MKVVVEGVVGWWCEGGGGGCGGVVRGGRGCGGMLGWFHVGCPNCEGGMTYFKRAFLSL